MPSFKLIVAGMMMTIGAVGTTHAAPIVFDLTDPDSRSGIYNSTYAKQYNYASDDVTLSVTGWSYGWKTTQTTRCTLQFAGRCYRTETVNVRTVNNKIEQEWVGMWDGLGVEKTDSPNHAVDNEANDYDMHLLSFSESVMLTSLDIGWYQGGTDISVLAFSGSLFDPASMLGKKWEDLLGAGWSVVGNYPNVDTQGNSGAINFEGVIAQYWLIGAYNPVFGDLLPSMNLLKTSKVKSNPDDYYKLKGVAFERVPPEEVPEPAAGLLLGASLMGLALARRRRTA